MRSLFVFLIGISLSCGGSVVAQSLEPYAYDIGSPSVVDYYIDSVNGSDSHSGRSVAAAWRTVQHAWAQVPQSATLHQGYRFNLMNGTYGNDELPNYWELRQGTANFPIILQPASGQTSVRLVRDINMANVSYFYLINLNITPSPAGDTFHCEGCNHILVRGCTLNGGATSNRAHETLKINQSQYVFIENNNISNADDNNVDFVAVQYGHIIGNKIHDALDWCGYVKGGSAYLRVESNEFSNCGTGGFTAGQGSGFQFMTSPWIHYEAYDIKVINNIVHDTEGAAFGVNGGYNVLVAHNTAYKVGTRDHLVEVVFGERTCDGITNGDADTSCSALNAAGGWGAGQVRLDPDPIGNRNVKILNNIFYNPAGTSAPQQFAIAGARVPATGANLSSPQYADTNLEIAGNIIWNGTNETSLGIEDTEQGCQDSNLGCNAAQLVSENAINSFEPAFLSAASSDFRPASGSNILGYTPAELTNFPGGDRESTPLAAEGVLSNNFLRDLSGTQSAGARVVGAFNSPLSSLAPPSIGNSTTPSDPGAVTAPTISRLKVSAARKSGKAKVSVTVRIASDAALTVTKATVKKGSQTLKTLRLRKSGADFKASDTVKASKGATLTVTVTATNAGGATLSVGRAKVK